MGHGLMIWRYVFIAFERNFQGACKRRFFLWEGKGKGRRRRRPREREREREKEREKEKEKGLVGIYPLDCTTSTEWATKIHRKRKGRSGGELGKERKE